MQQRDGTPGVIGGGCDMNDTILKMGFNTATAMWMGKSDG